MARTKWGFFPIQVLSGARPVVKQMPLASGTYYEGSLLRVSGTSGSAKLAAAGATCLLGVSLSYVTTANSTSGKHPVLVFNEDIVLEAKQITAVAPQTRVGDAADIAVGSTHNFRLAATAVAATGIATAPFVIVGFDPDESTSSHTGVMFWVKPNNYRFGKGGAA